MGRDGGMARGMAEIIIRKTLAGQRPEAARQASGGLTGRMPRGNHPTIKGISLLFMRKLCRRDWTFTMVAP
jgi:hypothetical protein